jgi:hypothetical protein
LAAAANASSVTRKGTGLSAVSGGEAILRRPVAGARNEILVKLQRWSDAGLKNLAAKHDAQIIPRQKPLLERIGYARLKMPPGTSVEAFLSRIKRDPSVGSGHSNAIMRPFGVPLIDQNPAPWGLQAINAPQAWETTRGQANVVVAVIDSGVDLHHPELTNSLVGGWNFLRESQPPDDDHGHGTQVAGIIAAEGKNRMGVIGVAPLCKIMPIKVLDANGEGTVADVAEAIIYAADAGCRVINLSLGTYLTCDVLREAVDYAASRNCVVVAAAGNNGCDQPCYPAAYGPAIGVAALNSSSNAVFFSNRGNYVDVAAPGDNIQTTARNADCLPLTGTSGSAAYVSGLAALILSRHPDLAWTTTKAIICASASDLGSPGWDAETGMGLIDCASALGRPLASQTSVGIIGFEVLPRSPMAGQQTRAFISVRNHGSAPTAPFFLRLKRGQATDKQTVEQPLAPKEIRECEMAWVPSAPAQESEAITAELPALPGETDLRDHTRTLAVPVSAASVHDVALVSCRTTGAPFLPGGKLSLEVQIANIGNQPETNIVVRSLFRKQPFAPDRYVSLCAGERLVFTCEWMCPQEVPGPSDVAVVHSLVFKAEPVRGEVSTNDNLRILRCGYRSGDFSVVPLHDTGNAYADNKYVHQWIANEAYKYFASQVEGADMEAHLGSISNSFIANNNNLLEGTIAEDQNSRDPLYDVLAYKAHFCASGEDINTGLLGFPSAYQQALNIWNNYAIPDYPGNKPRAFYRLGHVVHLLTDMTVPAHTHNDMHIPPDYDDYENNVVSYNGQFKWWYYGCTRAGDWHFPLSLHADLNSIFYRTANYTEDYDSDGDWFGADGHVTRGASAYFPSDYPTTWHRPAEVRRSGGFDGTERTIMCDDLMPYAIRRCADLYRLFYATVDTSDPSVSMTYPTSEDSASPTARNSLDAFNLTASGSDSESGILKLGYQFSWNYWDSSSGCWIGWQDVNALPASSSVSFTPARGEGYYCFDVWVENGGGRQGVSSVKYLRIVLPPPAPTANPASSVTSSGFTANWSSAAGATGYRLDVSTNTTFSSYVAGCQDLDVGNVLSRSVSGLNAGTTHYYRVRAYNAWETSGHSENISVATLPNHPPVMGPFRAWTVQNVPWVVQQGKLLSRAYDADGDLLAIVGVSATSTNGGTNVLGPSTITYYPMPNFVGQDEFTFTLSDGRGGFLTNTVDVTVAANAGTLNLVHPPQVVGDNFEAGFAGIPGWTYTVEWKELVTDPWQKLTNCTAPSAGAQMGIITVCQPAGPGVPTRFYRTVYPSY